MTVNSWMQEGFHLIDGMYSLKVIVSISMTIIIIIIIYYHVKYYFSIIISCAT